MSAAVLDIDVTPGDDLELPFTMTGLDITGRTYRAQIVDQTGALAATFTPTIINAPAGQVTVTLPRTESANIRVGRSHTYRWALEETVSGLRSEIVVGDVNVNAKVLT